MMWDVETTETFDNWFDAQTVALKEDLLAAMLILAEYSTVGQTLCGYG